MFGRLPVRLERFLRSRRMIMARSFLVTAVGVGLCWGALPQGGSAVGDRPSKLAWGAIRGQVTWGGKTIPRQTPLAINRDRDHCLSAGPVLSEDCVVSPKTKGVRWVLVYLVPEGKKPLPVHPDLKKPKANEVSLDIVPGRYDPHVLAMRAGQSLIVNNPGPICYNINWYGVGPKAQSGNVLMKPQDRYVIRDLKPERLVIHMRDNIHPWMKAWIKVFDHPYFAVTDADGKFTIPKAPAGKHRLVTWQESTGWGPGGKAGVIMEIQGGRVAEVRLKLMPVE